MKSAQAINYNQSQAFNEKFLIHERDKTLASEGRSITHRVTVSAQTWVLLGSLFLLLSGVVVLYFNYEEFKLIKLSRLESAGGIALIGFSLLLISYKVFFILYQLIQYARYKAIASVSDEELPICTVIVPAYNEGEMVFHTLLSLAKSDYPREKLQLLSIDDGSKDDTWQWMNKAKTVLGDVLQIHQFSENKGKRHALYFGIHESKGEVLVTVDSDSLVEYNTLRNLVSPFAVHSDCGAVAGNVLVLNKNKGIIPMMLNVGFAYSFELVRAAQSVSGSVLCTPGALAAYRKEAVLNCVEDWINQEFRGVKCDIGEDRAMTNLIHKQGFNVLFQSNAKVHTDIPENFRQLSKMYTRWERSNVRENINAARFVFRNYKKRNKGHIRLLMVNQWVKLVMAYPSWILLLTFLVYQPLFVLSSTFIGILVFSSLPALYFGLKRNFRESFWAYTYGLFYFFSLTWITPYAILTAGRKGWLTRG